jgi:hypothetical protein
MLAGRVTLEKWAIATAVLTAFREICELRPIELGKFQSERVLSYPEVDLDRVNSDYRYFNAFFANSTSWSARINVVPVDSGTIAVATGDQLVVTDASGGVINATAGTAQVGTLTGATVLAGFMVTVSRPTVTGEPWPA